MWIWDQAKGTLGISADTDPASHILSAGYSGFGEGKNNPALQNLPDVGPVPRGLYTIGPAHHDPEKGPVVMALLPDPGNEMFGRGGFLIHGDSIEHPGEASHGCIILDRETRETIAASGDSRLQVI